jgi:hypothetical protein
MVSISVSAARLLLWVHCGEVDLTLLWLVLVCAQWIMYAITNWEMNMWIQIVCTSEEQLNN